jgi:hypothetical protein
MTIKIANEITFWFPYPGLSFRDLNDCGLIMTLITMAV